MSCPRGSARTTWVPVTTTTLNARRAALAQSLLPAHACGMDLMQTVKPPFCEAPSADEASVDDMFAAVKEVAELNEMIRVGLAAARTGRRS